MDIFHELMRHQNRDQIDISAILALDWLAAPRTGLEYIEAVEAGRLWNNTVRARQEPKAKTKKNRPDRLKFGGDQ